MSERKTRKVSYLDPTTNQRVEKEVEIPPPVDVKTLPCGASVQEVPGMDALTRLWTAGTSPDLATPLTHASRQALAEELKKALDEDHEAIDALASTWQPPDDVALKVLNRLVKAVRRQKQKRAENVGINTTAQLEHDKALLEQKVKRLEGDNKALNEDVKKLVNERDDLKKNGAAKGSVVIQTAQNEARAARQALKTRDDDLRATQVKLSQTENALTASINESAALRKERDLLKSTLEQKVEEAITDYENSVTKKLVEVADEHNAKAIEVQQLREEVATLKGERNILRSRVEEAAQVKERAMSVNENVNEIPQTDERPLTAGDEVYCKVSGEGPFVLMTQVDEANIEYANPISNKRNTFAVGRLPVGGCWLVRCKDGSFRTFPAPALTNVKPGRTFSLAGVKGLVTSDVTAKLFQAAIWVAMMTLLYLTRMG